MYPDRSDNQTGLANGLGVLLITIGAWVGLWAAYLIYSILHKPDDIPLLARIVRSFESSQELISGKETDGGFLLPASDTSRGLVLLVSCD